MRDPLWRRWWPIGVLITLCAVIFVKNAHVGQYLIGWDSTTPELNFPLNFFRIIFGVWQEYRGLGTLDGMAHTANIVHWLITALMSKMLPVTDVRYAFQLLAHFIGGAGVYVLLRDFVVSHLHPNKRGTRFPQLLPLLGAVFYLFNFFTIQMFYLPLELFSIHFALFPWGLWSLLSYFEHGQKRQLFWLLIINLLGVSQAHVPTVVIPYVMVLAIFSLHWLFSRGRSQHSLKRLGMAALVIFAVNAFWSLPYLYATVSKSAEISNSKQNRLGTAGIFSRNYARSDLYSVATLGGFSLDYNDWDIEEEKFISVLEPWEEWYRSPIYVSIVLGFFVLSIWGVIAALGWAIREKQGRWWPYILSWFIALTMVGTKIPIIGGIAAQLRTHLPLFGQIFRFTFTKFSILYVLFQSIFLVIGVYLFLEFLARRHWVPAKKFLQGIVVVVLIAAAMLIGRPVFQGHFFYDALFVRIPDQYFSLFSYLNTHLENARIVNFPINSLWGWLTNTRQWGYRGSGFTWQAIRQPMVDRSFDPWSKTNETLFLQLNHALYSQDQDRFLNTLWKYHSNQVLMDQSIFHPGNYDGTLFYRETNNFFASMPEITETQRFGRMTLYEVARASGIELTAPQTAAALSNYRSDYATIDTAYAQLGNYFATEQGLEFQFSSLQQENLETPQLTENALEFSFEETGKSLQLPSFSELQPTVPAVISQRKNSLPLSSPNLTVTVDAQIPEVYFQNGTVMPAQTSWDLSLPNQNEDYYLSLNNWVTKTRFFDAADPMPLQHVSLSTQGDNSLLAFDSTIFSVLDRTDEYRQQAAQSCVLGQGVFTTVVSLPVSRASEIGLNPSQPVLLTVAADFQTDDSLIANACIREAGGECINENLERTASERPNWQTILTAVPLQPDKQYTVEFLGCKYKEGVWHSISYDAIWLQYYAFAGERTIPIAAVMSQYDSDLLAAASRQNFSGETKINIPLGGQHEFVINQNDQKQREENSQANCGVAKEGSVGKRLTETGVEYFSENKGVVCDTYLFPEIDESLQYLFHAKGENSVGSGLKLFLLNPKNKRFDIETVSGTGSFDLWQTLYPTTNRYFPEEGFFSLSVNGETFGREQNKTVLEKLEFYPLPLTWLTSITAGDQDQAVTRFDMEITSQKRRAPFLYRAEVLVRSEEGLLVLPQSFDRGWIALGKWGMKHTLYNGWANAWLVPRGEYTVMLLYWPQLLSFAGYGLLIGTFVWLVKKRS